jgi:hypothetical protein
MFAAVAMARLCPNLTLIRTPENDANLKETFDGSRESRQFMADALRMMQRNIISDPKHACHLTEEDCGAAGDDPEHGGTVCQYIKEK